jgi:PGF-pre-PGF domain-containing protein
MAKYFLAIIVSLCLLPLIASAAPDTVQFPQNTNIYLTTPNLTLTVSAGSKVAGITVNTGNVVFDLEAGSQVSIISPDKADLSANPTIATVSCEANQSQITLAGAATQSVTITPGNTCVAPIINAGGGGGGGGGGGAPTTAPTAGSNSGTVTTSGGGQVSLTTAEGAITVNVPTNAVSTDATVNVVSVTSTAVSTAAAPPPTGQSLVSAFNITTSAVATAATFTLTKAATLTFTYTDAQVANLNEASLQIYHFDDAKWTPIPSVVNAVTNTITATTTSFSYFAIMGQAGATKPVTTMTIEELKSEIARITALILQLQTELAKLGGTVQSFTSNLYYGLKNNAEVKRLQEFLISKGYLAAGFNTGSYLSLTMDAVKTYQTAKGITPVSGYFGPKTRAAVSADLGVTQ